MGVNGRFFIGSLSNRMNSRRKGHQFERDTGKILAKKLNIQYGKDLRRTPGSGATITRADLWIRPKYRDNFPYFVEMKNYSEEAWHLEGIDNDKWLPRLWYEDAVEKLGLDPDYDPEAPVLLIFKKNGIKPLCMLNVGDFNDLCGNTNFCPRWELTDCKRDLIIFPFDEFLGQINPVVEGS